MSREHLGDVARLAGPGAVQVTGCRDVPGLSGTPRERPVRDRPQQCLKEDVLTALGRAGVIIAGQALLAYEPIEDRFDFLLRAAIERGGARGGERLAEHGRVLKQRALDLIEVVEPRGDQ